MRNPFILFRSLIVFLILLPSVIFAQNLGSENKSSKFNSEYIKDYKNLFTTLFSLLSDNQKEVAKQYGVLGFGSMLTKRVTFIIDKKGKIAWIFPKVNIKKHSKEVLDLINKIST